MKVSEKVQSSIGILPLVFQQAVGHADVAISITDADANILYVNPAFCLVTGYSAGELVGRNQSILSYKTTPPEVYKAMWEQILRGESWNGRLVNKRKDGSRYLADLTITPVADAGGNRAMYLGMHRDATELHRLECRVRNQKALIESVVDAAPMVIALLGADDKVVLDNHEYKALMADLGMVEPAPLLLASIRSELSHESAAGTGGASRGGSYVFLDREVRIDRPGFNSPRWFSCSGVRVREDDDRADAFFTEQSRSYLLLVAKEITGLRAQQEKVRMAALQTMMSEEGRVSALRESLSAAMYQLEGPLNMIASAVAMLERRRDGNGAGSATLDALRQAAQMGEAALAGLRAKIPAETAEAEAVVNANELLRDVLEVSTRQLLAAGIRVTWKPQSVLPPLRGHPNKLRSLFKALIDNAVDAMSARGWRERELAVSTASLLGNVEVTIEDSGPGIPPELQLKVFEPFFTTRCEGGPHLGTGLAAAQQVAADHGGSIAIDPSPRRGTCVRVVLPVQR